MTMIPGSTRRSMSAKYINTLSQFTFLDDDDDDDACVSCGWGSSAVHAMCWDPSTDVTNAHRGGDDVNSISACSSSTR